MNLRYNLEVLRQCGELASNFDMLGCLIGWLEYLRMVGYRTRKCDANGVRVEVLAFRKKTEEMGIATKILRR